MHDYCHEMFFILQIIIVTVLGIFISKQCFRARIDLSLPPGPKRLPIVGNIMDLPLNGLSEFQHLLKHKEVYGPISSMTIMRKTFIFIHDHRIARGLLDKNPITTSGRPITEFASKLCGFDEFLAGQQYDNKFRRCRKLIHQQLGTISSASRFHHIQEVEVQRFLLQLMDQPGNLFVHLKR